MMSFHMTRFYQKIEKCHKTCFWCCFFFWHMKEVWFIDSFWFEGDFKWDNFGNNPSWKPSVGLGIAWKIGIIYTANKYSEFFISHFSNWQFHLWIFCQASTSKNKHSYDCDFLSLSCGRLFKSLPWLVELTPDRKDFFFSNHTENQQFFFFFFYTMSAWNPRRCLSHESHSTAESRPAVAPSRVPSLHVFLIGSLLPPLG